MQVRLKKFLEMRGADGGPWRMLCALPALWVGLIYDDEAQRQVGSGTGESAARRNTCVNTTRAVTAGLRALMQCPPAYVPALCCLCAAFGSARCPV